MEMQRQVDVDSAETALIQQGIVSSYDTPPGSFIPVLHPPPVVYSEQQIAPSLANRHDFDKLLSSTGRDKKSETFEGDSAELGDKLQLETLSAQLVREDVLMAFLPESITRALS